MGRFATYRYHFSFIYLCHSFPAIIENQPFTDFVKISCKKSCNNVWSVI